MSQRDDFVKSHISKQDELIKKAESIIENYGKQRCKESTSQIVNDAKITMQESESLIKLLKKKYNMKLNDLEKDKEKPAISDLNIQLKDSATSFISKVSKIEKENINL